MLGELEPGRHKERFPVSLTVGALITCKDKLVMILEPDGWAYPAGGVEEGETPFDAIRREVFEETRLTPNFASNAFDVCFMARPGRHSLGLVFSGRVEEVPNEDGWTVADSEIISVQPMSVVEIIKLIDRHQIAHPRFNVPQLTHWVLESLEKLDEYEFGLAKEWILNKFRAAEDGFSYTRDPLRYPYLVYNPWVGMQVVTLRARTYLELDEADVDLHRQAIAAKSSVTN